MRAFLACLVAVSCVASLSAPLAAADDNRPSRKDVAEEMQLINKSLEGLLSELATIKREATGRLSQVKSKLAEAQAVQGNQERIRQTKVSRFVLKRVAELESESLGMRDEMAKLFELQRKTFEGEQLNKRLSAGAELSQLVKQEDVEFEDTQAPTKRTTTSATATTTTTSGSSTSKPASDQEEAAQIGLDLEQLKRLGEEIGKRLDQLRKEAAKNLAELVEGIKLVFREPSRNGGNKPRASQELEKEIEARQAQGAESLRGVHEQAIRLVDNMVSNYLASVRRTVQRFNSFVDSRRTSLEGTQPRRADEGPVVRQQAESVVQQLQEVGKRFREFTMQWSRLLGKQQSPLIDRIPPRGVELWRDFWDTVRKQVRRINQEIWQVTRDMGRVVTGRPLATGGTQVVVRPAGELLYSAQDKNELTQQQIREQFEQFYEKLSSQLNKEQEKMNELSKANANQLRGQQQQLDNNLIDELDDEATKQELANNVALRQQIQQEINVFGSIFDIMRTFIARLRDSASTIRDMLTPPGAIVDNNPVTPGPAVKPTVDKLLEETINAQRNINSQARPTSRD